MICPPIESISHYNLFALAHSTQSHFIKGSVKGLAPSYPLFLPFLLRKRREHYAKLKLLISTETAGLEIASKTILIVWDYLY
jgi:hypothetical protein